MFELASLIIFGVLAQWVANRFKIPAILPLILIGLAVGPFSTLITSDGHKLVEPTWNGENGLFPGENLFYFVSLAVSVILFEGGMTLRRAEVLNVGPIVIKLVTLGVGVSFIGAGTAAHYIFGLDWDVSFLFASLVVITGPTVIGPILRHLPLKKDLSAVLRWEGIIIDPIGAVLAVLVYNFINSGKGLSFTYDALLGLGKILIVGLTLGFIVARGLVFFIRKNFIPKFLMNVATLALVLAVFTLADYLAHESGLVAVVVMGMTVGNMDLPNYKEILDFKESLSVLLVSILFILLAANINIEDLMLVYNWQALTLFLLIVFVIRPVGVFLSSINSSLNFREKLFVSWIGPRGIVAAGVSSLLGIKLVNNGIEGAEYITPLVFFIVLGTVLLNGITARPMAKLLGVFLKKPEGILIVGASKVSRLIASYLKENDRHVALIDINKSNIRLAEEQGLEAYVANIYDDLDDLFYDLPLADVGYVMALTGSAEINKTAVEKFQKPFGEKGTFRLVTPEESMDPEIKPREGLFSHTDDYNKLAAVERKYPQINEVAIRSQQHYAGMIEISKTNPDIIPLFIKNKDGDLKIIPSESQEVVIEDKGYKLVYLGQNPEDEKNRNKKSLD